MATLSDQVALITRRILSTANISPETDLETLQRMKQMWIEQARQAGYPDALWNVAAWLGQEIRFHHRTLRVWWTADITLVGGETHGRYIPAENLFEIFRWVAVYFNAGKLASNLDDVLLHADRLVYWRWQVVGEMVTEIDADLLFIPGEWVTAIVPANVQAQQKADMTLSLKVEAERQKLLAELLIVKNSDQ